MKKRSGGPAIIYMRKIDSLGYLMTDFWILHYFSIATKTHFLILLIMNDVSTLSAKQELFLNK